MTFDSSIDRQIRRYLLRESSDSESEQIEIRIMTDDGFAEEVRVIEDELVDEYLGGGLSAMQRARFETGYLATPQGKKHLVFAAAFNKSLSEGILAEESRRRKVPSIRQTVKRWVAGYAHSYRWVSIVSAALTLALLLITAVLILRIRNTDRQLEKLRSDMASSRQQDGGREEKTSVDRAATVVAQQDTRQGPLADNKILNRNSRGSHVGRLSIPVALVVLSPGDTRDGGDIQEVRAASSKGVVRIELILPESSRDSSEFESYKGLLKTAGRQIPISCSKGSRKDQKNRVFATLPVRDLPSNDYDLWLTGIEAGNESNIATYSFRLIKPE